MQKDLSQVGTEEVLRLLCHYGTAVVKDLNLETLSPKTVVRIHTRSGNAYFFEVIGAAKDGFVARMYQCITSGGMTAGYQGIWKIYFVQVGKIIIMDNEDGRRRITGRVEQIFLLPHPTDSH